MLSHKIHSLRELTLSLFEGTLNFLLLSYKSFAIFELECAKRASLHSSAFYYLKFIGANAL